MEMEMETDKKKYNPMENVLNKINQKYISLPENETKRNNKILEQVTDRIASLMMQKDVLFKNTYERKFYGGSFYDKLKVGKPEEYDLDFVLNLPLVISPVVVSSDKPGFVKINIKHYDKLLKRKEVRKFEKLNTLMDSSNYLSTTKVLQWIERTIHLSFKEFSKECDKLLYMDVDLGENHLTRIFITISKAHPAFTLKLRNKDGTINLDIDLVPCFQFNEVKWPKGYRKNPFPNVRGKFLIVPKKPHGLKDCDDFERYWRLSFQEQERDLIKGKELKTTKPAIKLLKKLRDKQNHSKIASYYIKTIILWKLETEDVNLWKQSLSYVFMKMLKEYADVIKNKNIPYYWNKGNNLIGHIKESTLVDIGNSLRNIITDIELNLNDPFVVAKYLIAPDELDSLKREVILGNKIRRKMKFTHNLFSPSTLANFHSHESEEQKIKKLILDQTFKQEVTDFVEKYLDRRK